MKSIVSASSAPRKRAPVDLGNLPLTLTLAHVAKLLSLSVSHVRLMARRKEIRSIKIGRARRIPREAIAEFLAGLAA